MAITLGSKRPDFTLAAVGGHLHIVEIKKSDHALSDKDFDRLSNYVEAFTEFFKKNPRLEKEFPLGWAIDVVCEGVKLKKPANKTALETYRRDKLVDLTSWTDFLTRAKNAHKAFLNASRKAKATVARMKARAAT